MELLDAVRLTIRRHAMLAGGETVLVGVSGGADSVALLHLLSLLAAKWRLRLHVLHVDHQLRTESGQDAEFVHALGRQLDVPVAVATVTVESAGSLEAAARAARYRALEAHADRIDADRIAIGHTREDQAETVLMRILGGAGVRGLAGIPPVRGRIIRPLIDTPRADLRAALHAAGLEWIEDPSNVDRKFLRNRIRHELLPFLTSSYAPDFVQSLVRTAALARDAVEGLEATARMELDRLATHDTESITLPLARVSALPPSVGAEVLRQAVARLGARPPLRAWAHRGLRRMLASPPPRRPFALGSVTVEVSVGQVRIACHPKSILPTRLLSVPGQLGLPEIGRVLQARVVSAERYEIPRERWRVAFDADELPEPLVVRPYRRGDQFAPFGGTKCRLKEFLIAAKVPRWERSCLPIVEASGEIAWIGGLRRGALAPVTPKTRRVFELLLTPLAQ